jgi:hypothetical protein
MLSPHKQGSDYSAETGFETHIVAHTNVHLHDLKFSGMKDGIQEVDVLPRRVAADEVLKAFAHWFVDSS